MLFLLFCVSGSDDLQPTSDGLQPNSDGLQRSISSDGLQPTSDGLQPSISSDGLQPKSTSKALALSHGMVWEIFSDTSTSGVWSFPVTFNTSKQFGPFAVSSLQPTPQVLDAGQDVQQNSVSQRLGEYTEEENV